MTTIYTALKITCDCPFCGKTYDLLVNARGYWLWQDGELIQNALPTLTANERESLISGLCTDCQAAFFNDDDDDEDEELDEEEFEYSENWNFDWDHLLG